MQIGRTLRLARKKYGLTQPQCARLAGVTQQAIQKAERLNAGLRAEALVALVTARVLKIEDGKVKVA